MVRKYNKFVIYVFPGVGRMGGFRFSWLKIDDSHSTWWLRFVKFLFFMNINIVSLHASMMFWAAVQGSWCDLVIRLGACRGKIPGDGVYVTGRRDGGFTIPSRISSSLSCSNSRSGD